jgi:penicillin-binding protein 1A
MTRWWQILLAIVAGLAVAVSAVVALAAAMIYPNLPSLESLTDYRPSSRCAFIPKMAA